MEREEREEKERRGALDAEPELRGEGVRGDEDATVISILFGVFVGKTLISDFGRFVE